MKTKKTLTGRTPRQHLFTALILTVCFFAVALPARAANGLQQSAIYAGLQNMLNDAMTVATILCPVFGGLAAVVFLIRRSMSDEQDGKMWNKRIITAIACGVGGGLISAIILLISSYFNPTI